MGILAFLGLCYIIGKIIAEQCQKQQPPFPISPHKRAEYQRDSGKVSLGEMSWKEMERRLNSGYYK